MFTFAASCVTPPSGSLLGEGTVCTQRCGCTAERLPVSSVPVTQPTSCLLHHYPQLLGPSAQAAPSPLKPWQSSLEVPSPSSWAPHCSGNAAISILSHLHISKSSGKAMHSFFFFFFFFGPLKKDSVRVCPVSISLWEHLRTNYCL